MSPNFFRIFLCLLLPVLHLTSGNKPEIRSFPGKVMRTGGDITIRCSSNESPGMFHLLNRENHSWYIYGNTNVYEQNFTVTNVLKNNSTDYYCRQYFMHHWSDPSDYLTLQLINVGKPTISACIQDGAKGKHLLITCTAPSAQSQKTKYSIERFTLHSGSEPHENLAVTKNSRDVTFKVTNFAGEYRCSYTLQVENNRIESPFSNIVKSTNIGDCKETNNNINDFGGGDEREDSTNSEDETEGFAKGALIPAVAGAAAGGFLCLILVVILLYVMRKKRTSPKTETNCILPENEQTESIIEPAYCTVEELRATTDMKVDMKDTVVDEDNYDGITYAKLNRNILKKDTQPEKPTDTSLYAVVKKNKP
ncbi:leukocyte immunoglobulin-like receptor subfamily B member 5 isoform 2-T2 [Anomaloglossus baeobatrachus]|uniref:leukocyte immunoglobulin-like receptor subfamily B member 5 isoform X2 n=1 Tax=Anomaloglossus baeobatrachus TaxID=238106 RepID=UPI003F501526